MSGAKLRDFMEQPDQKVILVYDFLRMWIFLIELLERTEEIIETPTTVLSIGMAPPEDSRIVNLEEEEEFGMEDEDDFDSDDDFEDDQVLVVHPDGRTSRRRCSSCLADTVKVFVYLQDTETLVN